MALPNSVLIGCMLLFGSWNTLNTKFQYQTCAPTLDESAAADKKNKCPDGQRYFGKSWMQNTMMFMGEASLMLVYGATQRERRLRVQAEAPRLLEDGSIAKKTPFYIYAVPAFCDVFGTGLAAVAMKYIPSALWQMLRSAIIIFSAILSYFFLGRKFQPFHWVAVGIVCVGIFTVGVANVLDPPDPNDPTSSASVGERVFGMVLVVSAQLCAASQMVIEEKLLTGGAKTSAKKVVGSEGVWGIIYMTVGLTIMTLVPGSDDGKFENVPDGVKMITGSFPLAFLVVTYMMSISIYNLTGITVGKKMSAVVRCLVDSCRTVTVWGITLLIYYAGAKEYGAPWTPYSWLQVIGFLILIFGTLLYQEILAAPDFLKTATAGTLAYNEDIPRDSSTVSNLLCKDPLIAGHLHTVSDDEETKPPNDWPVAQISETSGTSMQETQS